MYYDKIHTQALSGTNLSGLRLRSAFYVLTNERLET